MELPAFRKEGSNRHIKGCERASEQFKLEIRGMNNRERERAAELMSLHDMESLSHALDKEEQKIESAFLGSIRVNLFQHMQEVLKGVTQVTQGHIGQTFQVRQV
ncbi:hypothetical protein R1flu_013425 [Riccia fluitans]|uniref:Uncharacterized protein n=1 Tax=Riccia fluitans TaxID=41844 RepID=A0ABD1YED2_9MARC